MSIPDTARPVFIHSLFRSGSTFLYHALKRTGQFQVYHEPFHEVMQRLPTEWDSFASGTDQLKASLHHDFLDTGYFDEFAGILPILAETFTADLSYGLFFLDAADDAPGLRAYIDALLQASTKRPVLQCTRTVGRIAWLKRNYPSTNVFLLRNPWDQWYSYKVDFYISATPQVIYSQACLPQPLQDVAAANGFSRLPRSDGAGQWQFAFQHPLAPRVDYALFFGLWLFALLTTQAECELVLDMDEASRCSETRAAASEALARIGLGGIDLSDCRVHRTAFQRQEMGFYEDLEEQVIEIFRKSAGKEAVLAAQHYLVRQREVSFGGLQVQEAEILEDASRLRHNLLTRGEETAQLVAELHQQATGLSAEIQSIKGSRAWKVAQRLQQVRAVLVPQGSRRARLLEGLHRLLGKLVPLER